MSREGTCTKFVYNIVSDVISVSYLEVVLFAFVDTVYVKRRGYMHQALMHYESTRSKRYSLDTLQSFSESFLI
jgi:hypothetical protein